MKDVLICVHCGTAVSLEPRTDSAGTRLLAHLLGLHRDILPFDEMPLLVRAG